MNFGFSRFGFGAPATLGSGAWMMCTASQLDSAAYAEAGRLLQFLKGRKQ